MIETNAKLIKQYKDFYFYTLNDRENIQSRLRLYLFISISSFAFSFYILTNSPYSKCWIIFSYSIAAIIVFLHFYIGWIGFKIFSLKDYKNFPKLEKIKDEIKNSKSDIDEAVNEELLKHYSNMSASNFKTNQCRRKYMDKLVKSYFFIGGVCYLWFIVFLISKLKEVL